MKITITKTNNTSFGTIIIPQKKVSTKIIYKLGDEQIQNLINNLIEQRNNPVNAIISQGLFGLKAKLTCNYRLKNFIEDYNQKPLIEEIVGKYMFNTYVVKYDKTINPNLIKRNHVFISDKNGDVYVIAYDSGDNLDITQKAMYTQIHKAMHDFKKSLDPIIGASK